jgi:hypothetical protein
MLTTMMIRVLSRVLSEHTRDHACSRRMSRRATIGVHSRKSAFAPRSDIAEMANVPVLSLAVAAAVV